MAPPNLPNNDPRFIQLEETSVKNSFSESLLQGLGKDLNYIKAQLDAIQAQINTYNSGNPLGLSEIFSLSGTVPSPGGNIICAIVAFFQSNSLVTSDWKAVIPGVTTYFPAPGDMGNPPSPGATAAISGTSLVLANWGHEWVGGMVYIR